MLRVLSAVQVPFPQRLVPCLRTVASPARPTPPLQQAAQRVLAMRDTRAQANAQLARQASSRLSSEMLPVWIVDRGNILWSRLPSSVTTALQIPMLEPAHPNAFATQGTRARINLALRVRLGRSSRPLGQEIASSVQPASSLLLWALLQTPHAPTASLATMLTKQARWRASHAPCTRLQILEPQSVCVSLDTRQLVACALLASLGSTRQP